MKPYLMVNVAASLLAGAGAQKLHQHDDSFIPDYELYVTRQNIGIGGIERYTTLVNNTLPGPELRFKEGEVVWIRVHNDMPESNLTMVSSW
jgi:L-ascorbate oxidase